MYFENIPAREIPYISKDLGMTFTLIKLSKELFYILKILYDCASEYNLIYQNWE